MSIRNCSRHLFDFLFLLTFLVLITSCSSPDATFGDRLKIDESFEFYVATGYNKYITVSEDAYEFMLADPVWSVSDGLILEEVGLDIAPTDVSWTVGDTTYTVKGLKLSVDARVLVAEDTNAGKKSVMVKLPGLPMVADALKGRLEFPNDGFVPPDSVRVTTITVHESATARNFAIIGKAILIAIIAVVVLAIIAKYS